MVDAFHKQEIQGPAQRILDRVARHESYGIQADRRATGLEAQQVLHHLEVYEARMLTMRTQLLDLLGMNESTSFGALSNTMVRIFLIDPHDFSGLGKRDSIACEETLKILLAQMVREQLITMTAKTYDEINNNTRITRIS